MLELEAKLRVGFILDSSNKNSAEDVTARSSRTESKISHWACIETVQIKS